MTSLQDRFTQKYGRVPTEFDRDYLEMLRMSKYRIVDVPDFKPANCANCGSTKNDGRKYIDFGLELDWHGIVFLCGECLFDIATAMGLFVQLQQKVQELQDSILKINTDHQRGIQLRDEFLKVFEEVQNYFTSLPAVGDGTTTNPDLKLVVNETASKSGTGADKSATDGTKPRAIKSTTSSGPKNIPSLAELLASSSEE
jgi:hypothetical protein